MLWSNRKRVESTRHYYSDDKLFEKSLDIYKPKDAAPNKDLPVVVLVVGSGWVGHRALVYLQTSWWNSSGPKTVAGLGTTCVCIRHRGAFCVLPSAIHIGVFLALVLAFAWDVTGGQWKFAFAVTALLAFLIALIALGGRGSAKFEDQLTDVAEALLWIENNKHMLDINLTEEQRNLVASKSASSSSAAVVGMTDTSIPRSSDSVNVDTSSSRSSSFSSNDSDSDLEPSSPPNMHDPSRDHHRRDVPLVFGGYSSGGHVAATLLQHPEIFKKYNLPRPEKLFQGILIISGVLAVRPERVKIAATSAHKATIIETPQDAPQWLSDVVVRAVWGPDYCRKLPSPLVAAVKENRPPPSLPHLLIGCRNEVFGLNWLDIFFCSRAYRDMIQLTVEQPAKYVQVESDHWNILNSTELRTALQDELPALISTK